jgi:hypothetical protein
MIPQPIEITCPRNPDHGKATKRWLPPVERQNITSLKVDDVYEVDCAICGRFEWAAANQLK